MNKLRIKVKTTTDLIQTLDDLNKRLANLGIPNDERETILQGMGKIANDLARRGKELTSIGAQFHVERVFTSESCQVILDAEFKPIKLTLGSWLRAFFLKLRG